ncbi:DUF6415 family natural product biosynthesis protein [Streptomyces sp. NPDC054952]
MTTPVKAHTFQVAREQGFAGLPPDIVMISESISIILEPREATPPAALRGLWLSRLSGHLALLLPVVATPSRDRAEAGQDTLIADIVTFVHEVLGRGLPDDAEAAYVQLQELARICRFLLGTACDPPRERP